MALSAAGLDVVLGRRRVLAAADVTLMPGRVTAILGPNGAGKSSLLKALAGVAPVAAGRVTLDGRDLAKLSARDRALRIGYLPQDGQVHWRIAAGEVVMLGRAARRSPFAGPSATDRDAVAAAMAATDTAALAERDVTTLSGGERARVLLARVLAGEPKWVLADEPLAGLDPRHQLDLLARLRAAAAQGVGVAVVVHDIAQAARVADDAVLVADARIVAAGPAADVLTPERLGTLFGVTVRQVADVLVVG